MLARADLEGKAHQVQATTTTPLPLKFFHIIFFMTVLVLYSGLRMLSVIIKKVVFQISLIWNIYPIRILRLFIYSYAYAPTKPHTTTPPHPTLCIFFNAIGYEHEAETKLLPFHWWHLKCILLNKNVSISFKVSLNFVPKVRISRISALVQIVAWRQPGDKPLSEQWWLVYWRIYASLALSGLILISFPWYFLNLVGLFSLNAHLHMFTDNKQQWDLKQAVSVALSSPTYPGHIKTKLVTSIILG